MQNNAPSKPLIDAHDVDNLIAGMVLVPSHQREKAKPADDTHLWLNTTAATVWAAEERAGLNGKVLSQQGAAPAVYVPLTPALQEAIESRGIYTPADSKSYFLELNHGSLRMRYQQILGSAELTPFDDVLHNKVVDAMARKMLDNPDFTNPVVRFAPNPEWNARGHGFVVPNPTVRVSAAIADKAETQKTLEVLHAQLSAPVSTAATTPSKESPSKRIDSLTRDIGDALGGIQNKLFDDVEPPKAAASKPTRASNVSSKVLDELALLTVDDAHPQRLMLPQEHLDNYAAVKKLVTQAGGKYSSKGYFEFPVGIDVADAHATLIAGHIVNGKKDAQFFATPKVEAEDLCDRAGPLKGKRVLEPSAGDGAVADVARERGAEVTVVENWAVNVHKLKAKGYDVIDRDFLTLTPDDIGKFDAIIANPPFHNNLDIDHVRHMAKFLEPDGVLSVITSTAWQNESTAKQKEFAKWIEGIGADISPIPAGAFKLSGTAVPALKLTILAERLDLELDEVEAPKSRAGMRP